MLWPLGNPARLFVTAPISYCRSKVLALSYIPAGACMEPETLIGFDEAESSAEVGAFECSDNSIGGCLGAEAD